ncbi:condensation domain-containing protein, partial [Micromonospora azadirachtae]
MTKEWSFPASFAQERIWIANQLDAASPVYNISNPWVFPPGMTAEQATDAFNQIVARHEALRTHLRVDDGTLVQVVRAAERFELPVVDLRERSDAEQERRYDAELTELARTPIPLDAPPLWRARLHQLADDRVMLLFVVHHAVYDSHSSVIFTAELAAFSRAALTGAPAEVPELPIQYADFA